MLHPARLLRRLVALFTARRLDDELDEELRFHLEMEASRLMRDGVPEQEARARARRLFGGVGRHRDDARDARGVRPVEDFLHDLRIGLRALTRQRTFASVAILTLALGIGGTTALGSGVYHVLWAPLPFPDADRMVVLWQTNALRPGETQPIAPANFLDLKRGSRAFSQLAAAEPFGLDWIGPDGPETFETSLVTDQFIAMQGLRALLGRTFLPEEYEAGRSNVVMLTESLWRTRFGSDSSLVGRTLVLDTVPHVVVGILPEGALRPFAADMFAPKVFRESELRSRTDGWWEIGGLLAPDVTLAEANAELKAIAARLGAEYPATNANTGFTAVPLRDAMIGQARAPLLILLGAAAFVMLIACVNVASLQLAEVVRRRREVAIRTAVGAGLGRLVRQLLTESLLLALIGSTAGLAIAWAGIRAIRTFTPNELWQLRNLAFDASTIGLAVLLALIATVVIGAVPVAAVTRVRLADSLGAAGGTRDASVGHARRRAGRGLVLAEVSLALVLLVGAGLLLRSLGRITSTDPGFDATGVHVATYQLWSYYPTAPHRMAFVQQAEDRLRAIPGVEEVGATSAMPLDWPIGLERVPIAIEGRPQPPGDEQYVVRTAAVTPGLFDALGMTMLAGRRITTDDRAGTVPVAVVNEAFARRFFADESPIGQRVVLGFMSARIAREIVGVVGDVRHDGLHVSPPPGIYIPHTQAPTGAVHFAIRAPGVADISRQIRQAFLELNGTMPFARIGTLDALVSRSLAQRRFQLGLLTCFSITALLLAAIGIYGVMNRATAERTHEIGVRMAMGAHTSDVRWMVLRSGGILALGGVGLGLLGAFLLTRTMAGMLYGVTPLDPLTYAAAAMLLVLVAVLATLIPAWRASSVAPVVALRSD